MRYFMLFSHGWHCHFLDFIVARIMYTELETTAMIRHPEARTLITEHTSTLAVLTESFVYISFLDFMRHVAWWLFQSRIPLLPHLKLNSPIISFVCNLFLSFLIVSKHFFASILLCYVKLLTTETDVMARLDFMRYTLMINFGQIFFIEIFLCFLAATLRVFLQNWKRATSYWIGKRFLPPHHGSLLN